jgi:hypothetical protein
VKRIAILTILFLLLGTAAVACDCGGGGGGEPPTSPSSPDEDGGGATTTPESRPDLVVSQIEVFPVYPQAGQFFSVNVYVSNQGQAPSGSYDIAIDIEDVSHGGTYPIGTFRRGAVNPGENYCAYTSTNVRVNDPGDYRVNVDIIPFQFEDGSTWNNSVYKPFTVK